MDPHPPRDADDPGGSLIRLTDRARRALRRAQVLLGALAVVIAIPVGAAAAGAVSTPPADAGTVQAVLLAPATTPAAAVTGAQIPTPARWAMPDGGMRTELVWVESGLAPGTTVTVPLDAFGGAAAPKIRPEDPRVTGVLAGTATLFVCWALLAIAAAVGRARMDAIDDRSWATGWAEVEPIWSGRTTP